jgi:alkaline phosphatase D
VEYTLTSCPIFWDHLTRTPETLKRDWDRLAAIPEFKKFRASVPIMATWDNHDYGKYDGGGSKFKPDTSGEGRP